MTIFEDYLNFRRIEHLRLDGTTKHEDRSTLLKLFNDPNSKYPIFILSTRAGGLGLNLQTADTVIIFDSDWNPHQDLQAQDRAHRIGQKKEVRILRLVTERSVEEHVMAGAARKIEMDKKIIQAGRYDNKSTAEERDAFLRALLEAEDGEPEDADDADEADMLNEAIARTEEERALFAQMDRDRRAAEEAAWAAAGNTGKLPERLIQEWELPHVYRMDHPKLEPEDESREGARRNRTQVQYDDGMSEEQWLHALEEEEDDDDSEKKRGKRRAVTENAPRYAFDDALPSESEDGDGRKRLKRGRQSGAGTPSVNGDDDASRASGGKRRKVQLSPYQEKLRACFEELLTEMENLDNVRFSFSLASPSRVRLFPSLTWISPAYDGSPMRWRESSTAAISVRACLARGTDLARPLHSSSTNCRRGETTPTITSTSIVRSYVDHWRLACTETAADLCFDLARA